MSKIIASLASELWQFRIRFRPELGILKGVIPKEPCLDEYTLKAYQGRLDFCHAFKDKLLGVGSNDLGDVDRVSLHMMKYYVQSIIHGEPYQGYLQPLNYYEGPEFYFTRFTVPVLPFETPEHFEYYLKLLSQFPTQIEGIICLMQEGVNKGIVPNRLSIIPGAINKIDRIITTPCQKTDFYKPFLNVKDSELTAKAMHIIEDQIFKSLKRLLEFIRNDYVPHLRSDLSVDSVGAGRYQAMIKFFCDTDMPATDIHQIGLQQVERTKGRMKRIMESFKFKGTIQDFRHHLDSMEDQWFRTEQDLKEYCQNFLCEVIYPKLNLYFPHSPKYPIDIEVDPREVSVSKAIYSNPSGDGAVNGRIDLEHNSLKTLPKYEIPVLMAHEGVPGHHMQACYSLDMPDLPDFRKFKDERPYFEAPSAFPMNCAYTEGWGLYCEELALEMGIYRNSMEEFGYLVYDLSRCARVVVNTGLHALGWTRKMAEDYMVENTTLPQDTIQYEIDKFVTWPAQACAYKLGHLRIIDLRQKCQERLGDAFDVREFHDICLSCGQVPLDVLETIVENHILRKKAEARGK